MKPNFKFVLILSFFALLFASSCQSEFLEESSQNQEETLVPESPLTGVMRSTVTNAGSLDNILDESSCFSVNLPVTIIANGVTITIDSLEDLEVIEEIYDEFEDDTDNLDFLFPITIIFNNYEEVLIENEDALEAFIEDCVENDIEDTIECVDFIYPISMSIYNSVFQVIDNVTFNNDEELYDFLEELEDETDDQIIIASLDFPVSLIYADGTTVEVNSNQELQNAINAAEEDCYGEDEDCNEEDISMYLQECVWEIESFNGDDNYQEVDFIFMEDGVVKILNSNGFYEYGTWNISMSNDNSAEIVIEGFEEYIMFNGSWIVIECDDDELKIVKEVEGVVTTVVLDQECEDDIDCSAQEMIYELKECKWWMGTSLLSPNYSGPLFFEDDNVLHVGYPDNNQLQGTWEIALTDSGILMILMVGGDYEVIALDWTLIECEDDRYKFVSGDHYLVLEQECVEYDCEDMQANYGDECQTANGTVGIINENCECEEENSNVFDCFENEVETECDEGNEFDGIEVFNLNSFYEDCLTDNLEISYHFSESDAHNNVEPLLNEYENVENEQIIFARVTIAGTETYQIFTVTLVVENCNNSGCSETELDNILMECIWIPVNVNGSDDFSNSAMIFGDNQAVTIEGFGETYTGNWQTSGNSSNGVWLTITQLGGNFELVNGQWLVVECSEEMLHLESGDNTLILERECN